MEKEANIKIASLKVDGGITVNNFINQFQADILQKKIIKTLVKDSTCLGSAMIAGLGAGIFKNYSEIKANIKTEKEFNFNPQENHRFEELYRNWKKNIQCYLAD
jgi:glycerol kinase